MSRRDAMAVTGLATPGYAICSNVHCCGALSARAVTSCHAGSVPRYMVETNLDDQFRLHRLPFSAALRAPAAQAARCLAGEAQPTSQRLELRRERRAVFIGDGRCEADMIELPLIVVETEQQRSNLSFAVQIAEATDHASAVRSRLTLTIARSPGRYGSLSILATTPSVEPWPAPCSHCLAVTP